MARTIGVANQKGGLEKRLPPSTWQPVFAILEYKRNAAGGCRSADNSTTGVGFRPCWNVTRSLYDCMVNEAPRQEMWSSEAALPYLDLILPISTWLVRRSEMINYEPWSIENPGTVKDECDFIVIDCSPVPASSPWTHSLRPTVWWFPFQTRFFALEDGQTAQYGQDR